MNSSQSSKTGPIITDLSPGMDDTFTADNLKEQGNSAFRLGDYKKALDLYSRAHLAAPKNDIILCNKAAALSKLNRFEEAERDCSLALSLNPSYVKCWHRRATIRKSMRKFQQALDDLNRGLEIDPSNETIKSEITEVNKLIQQSLTPGGVQFSQKSQVPKKKQAQPQPSTKPPPAQEVQSSSIPQKTTKLVIEEVKSENRQVHPPKTQKLQHQKIEIEPTLPSEPVTNWVDFDRHFRILRNYLPMLSTMMIQIPLSAITNIFAVQFEQAHLYAFVQMMLLDESPFLKPEQVEHTIKFWQELGKCSNWNIARLSLTKPEKGELAQLYSKLTELNESATALKKQFGIK
ncbi:putative RNA polymerase II-associated protein 3 [Blattamonas nauphoetae]|uniref:RNA polymerase II-associated protein 3 n=1 Tax=Blattamonas nauphoetae TaxID=2049346 RepID=A0ABQ9Y151_9EUKA|nr:putative RNA polymerase II-associated protein 3 [Blattamonas nauphoetae]